ncbi:PTS sugar transporter subunit IIB [Nitratireductor aquimarinus]|uniref:PTS sugar transporter subunit IIB n=1 Tax=Nitratireductor aquimarinus TaxID=889300 RepID=A0ABU4AP12_9HYPH|nr:MULTISPECIES: PTS sugar transporter subunit IIB [Alphaproteobacteria]MBY6020349.1 PTS sugar transporter subunit IIB [Nitratireductor sp. DP7N14-4]MBN7755563.1 PTS sugar transporter subunit IIB [Nitratireductor aquimarinus]MBN7763358.1 PTS sugar transporter subunit IIB [Nitratireductor aquibiodomus]MBN7775921.1 PTS sugar transporter subunit IIB [Nitratireductor pacificus]MBN7780584.1 PTS sugar transporter subunit IIB [Nitratireductor pacificus]
MSKKTVLFACGTGIATSTVVANAVTEAMKERGITIEPRQCKATEVRSELTGVDLIVSTTQLPSDLDVPSIVTLAFLTGMGKAEALDKIEGELRK